MPVTTIPQISDVLDQHSVRIDAAQADADFAQTESARALTSIYDVDLGAKLYTDAEIQKLKDLLRTEYAAADGSINTALDTAIDGKISAALPGLLNTYYGNYAGMQALYDELLIRFGQSDAAIDHLLNNVVPGLAQNVDNLSLTASTVAQDFTALQDSLKSVFIVYADNAAGANQSLTAGGREYVLYYEYNGTPPTLPVTGTFVKFVGTAQSTWPIYASTAAGNDQSFEPGARQYVTFYNSPVAPDLPVSGQTFVKYVGSNGAEGERGAGIWYVSVSSLPAASSTAARDAWNSAVSGGQDIPVRPKIQDQVYFYTGLQGNPTGQRVFICNWVTSNTSHGWDYQENVMRGDLLVPGTVTSNEIDARGLSIRDELGNIILQATGGSAGINLNRVIGAGQFAGLNQITASNVSTYIAAAAIGSAYIGDLSANKITTGTLNTNRLNLDGAKLTVRNGKLAITYNGIDTGEIAANAATDSGRSTTTNATNLNAQCYCPNGSDVMCWISVAVENNSSSSCTIGLKLAQTVRTTAVVPGNQRVIVSLCWSGIISGAGNYTLTATAVGGNPSYGDCSAIIMSRYR